jgi:hypothetical protein
VKVVNKKILFVLALALIAAILIYKNPVEISREFWGTTQSSVSANSNKSILIRIEGELYRNLLSRDSFSGVIVVDGKSIHVQTPIPANINMRIKGIGDKFSGMPIEVVEAQVENGFTKIRGRVMFSREFDMVWGYSDTLREQYNDNDLTFAGQQNALE